MTLTRKIHVEFVNPYVTSGLIAFWDGIWNVGYGKHDATAAAWRDLTGNGHDLSQSTGSVNWTDNALQIGAADSLYGTGAAFEDIWNLTMSQTASTSLTLEIGYIADMDWSSGTIFISSLTGQWANACIGGIAIQDAVDPETKQKPVNTFSNGAIASGLTFGSGIRKPFFAAATFTYNVNSGKFDCSTFADGAHYHDHAGLSRYTMSMSKIGFGILPSSNYRHFLGRIHFARLYRRALTPTEIAANYAGDKERFGGEKSPAS